MSLPAADDLFRGNRPMTAVPDEPPQEPQRDSGAEAYRQLARELIARGDAA